MKTTLLPHRQGTRANPACSAAAVKDAITTVVGERPLGCIKAFAVGLRVQFRAGLHRYSYEGLRYQKPEI